MKIQSLVTLSILLSAILGTFTLAAFAATGPLDSSSISYTLTTTTSWSVSSGGGLQVNFNSVQLTQPPPQTYSFGVEARTTPGNWITRLNWQFGDGEVKDIPYCCQPTVSEVQYHSYNQPGTYTITVIAYDNMGNFGNAHVTVNWITPIPEYPSYSLPLVASLLAVLIAAAMMRKGIKGSPFPPVLR